MVMQVILLFLIFTEKDIVLNMLGMAASGELAYTPSPRDISQRPSSRPASQQVQYSYHWEPNASHTVHESEPIAEECEMMETFGTQKRTSATPKENTCDVSHAEQWLRSHGGSRCRWGGDAVMECNSQMGGKWEMCSMTSTEYNIHKSVQDNSLIVRCCTAYSYGCLLL